LINLQEQINGVIEELLEEDGMNITDTGYPRRNVQDFGRVFLMLKYTDITQNNYVQS